MRHNARDADAAETISEELRGMIVVAGPDLAGGIVGMNFGRQIVRWDFIRSLVA
ncbi:MAG: hypothetical protein WB949_05965 [Candidatus Acidiferrales bacterium]